MATTATAVFPQTPKSQTLTSTSAVANIGSGSPTNAVVLMTAGINGAMVTKITAIPMGTVTASSIVLFESSTSSQLTTYFPVDSELMPQYTAANNTALPEINFINISKTNPKIVGAGMSLSIGSQVAQASGISYHVEWMDL